METYMGLRLIYCSDVANTSELDINTLLLIHCSVNFWMQTH